MSGLIATAGISPSLSKSSVNPYAGHRLLSDKEQQVLGEYARLAATIKRVTTLSANLSSSERHAGLLNDLRILERKMGLVLTLFKASVWSLIQTHQDELEEEEQRRQQQQQDEMEYSSNPTAAAHEGELDETITRQGYIF